jgi:hypothetical protein
VVLLEFFLFAVIVEGIPGYAAGLRGYGLLVAILFGLWPTYLIVSFIAARVFARDIESTGNTHDFRHDSSRPGEMFTFVSRSLASEAIVVRVIAFMAWPIYVALSAARDYANRELGRTTPLDVVRTVASSQGAIAKVFLVLGYSGGCAAS